MIIPSIYDASGLPQVGDVVASWARPIVVGLVTKTMRNEEVVEAVEEISTRGMIQPFTSSQLALKPEGQRTWDWSALHVLPDLDAKLDDIITMYGRRFRVMTKKDYTLYGYIRYELVENYTEVGNG